MKFVFPEPGALEGVKSRSKVILRMNNVSFTYPTKAFVHAFSSRFHAF